MSHKTNLQNNNIDLQSILDMINALGLVYDIKETFSDNSWEQIILACQNNAVPDTWAVGDSKAMTINGVNYMIDIIGKNHDIYSDGSGTAPLTFQFHNLYDTQYPMVADATSTNWSNSTMRTVYLTDVLALMPIVVQTAIKNINKSTYIRPSTTIEITEERLFLLSEIEIFGQVSQSKGAGEGNQYEYYSIDKNNISKEYLSYNGVPTYWERSVIGSLNYFCRVRDDAYPYYASGTSNMGIAPAFCF